MTLRLGAVGPSADDPSAVLFADEAAIHQLIAQLRRLDSGDWTADLTDPPGASEPALRRLSVRATDTPLHVHLSGNVLHIDGAPAHLNTLADYLALYAEHNDLNEPGMHCHIDTSDPHADEWVDPASTPLTIAGWVPDY